MKTKMCPVVGLKTPTGDAELGQFEAIVSVFGNKDSYGDVVVKGAFARTLGAWSSKGDPIPIYWSHRMDDPDYNIGYVMEAEERDEGLWVKGQLDLESAKAAQVYRLLKGRRVTQFSFAYDVEQYAVKMDAALGEYIELQELSLYEVGPTPIGANQSTELLAVKDARHVADRLAGEIKAGRALSAKNEGEIKAAHDALGRVLQSLGGDEQAASSASGSDEDEAGIGKSQIPANALSVSLVEAELQLLLLEG